MLARFDLSGKRFVVTGASSGIGRAAAGHLAAAGARVLLLARREAQLADAAAQINAECDARAKYLPADLGARESLPATARECMQMLGEVDGVINAAGVNLRQDAKDITPRDWDQTMDINLAAPFFFAREFVADMQQRGFGRIINFSSLQSVRAFENGLAYAASKGGVQQLTRAMARAWSQGGVTCNAIAPGFFPTELTAPVFNDAEKRKQTAARTALGRNGELDDLAGAVIFFASDASAYVTGQTLFVDGGFTIS